VVNYTVYSICQFLGRQLNSALNDKKIPLCGFLLSPANKKPFVFKEKTKGRFFRNRPGELPGHLEDYT